MRRCGEAREYPPEKGPHMAEEQRELVWLEVEA
jgi:hypothetical protein